MSAPTVAVLMAVRDGAPWLPAVLAGLAAQREVTPRVLLWDNGSTDGSADLVRATFPAAVVRGSGENIGFWAAVERLLPECDEDVVVALTDVVLEPDFLRHAVDALADPLVGAVQGKVLQPERPDQPDVIDTIGFAIGRDRHVTIAGHGEPDDGRADTPREVFAVEGAVPVFRRAALLDAMVDGALVDRDFRVDGLGYGDDLDLAWRLQLLGWKQVLVPRAIGRHDRSTTTSRSAPGTSARARSARRHAIPAEKRILDYCNVRCAVLKNDRARDLLPAAFAVLMRELTVLAFLVLFERDTLPGVARLVRLTPRMLRRRREVQRRARGDMGRWFR